MLMANYLMSWSGGKDSALALHTCIINKDIQISGLITTVNAQNNRISMHGVSAELLRQQAKLIGLPFHVIPLPDPCSMDEYERIMLEFLTIQKQNGIEGVVFGDIFLEDIRQYREQQLSKLGLKAIFPLWGKSSAEITQQFLSFGFKAIVTSVDGSLLNENHVGIGYTFDFANDLPSNVDICGENGEFHSFVTDGPIFRLPLNVGVGDVVKKEFPNPTGGEHKPYWFADLISISQTE